MELLRNLSLKAHRRAVQFLSLLLLHSSWGPDVKWLCNPVLSCHSCALAWFACPIGVFIHYSSYRIFPFLAFGTVLLLGILLGRLLCGWICPFGLLQDLLYKIPSPKFALPPWTAWGKYLVLIGLVILVPFFLGENSAWGFCRFCPASALQVTLPNLVTSGPSGFSSSTAIKLGALLGVIALTIFSSRGFCKAFCPIGAMLAPLNYITFWKIKVPTENCIACRKCDRSCPQQMQPSQKMAQGCPPNRSGECILCYECQRICPQPNRPAAAIQPAQPPSGPRE